MSRPKLTRRVHFRPGVVYFKPRGVPLSSLSVVSLFPDEVEALKLHELDSLSHADSAKKMGVSQPTFTRILTSANHKLSLAIIRGYAISLELKQEAK